MSSVGPQGPPGRVFTKHELDLIVEVNNLHNQIVYESRRCGELMVAISEAYNSLMLGNREEALGTLDGVMNRERPE